ncbi:hypothetical protein [Microbacterium halotolerans]|uniref:hypothetical protein n=1 Tax=Microbacterium halotolerans TaxID=246613 RepID=UPI000E6AA629|nr:hypothetical protein [Microbacterium halotolerans]
MATDTTPHGETPISEKPAEPTASDPAQGADGEKPGETPQPAETDYKAEARKWEKRAKENRELARANEEAARRLKEFEDAQKTEEQKTAERIAQLEKENTSYRQREQVQKWAGEVSETTGVPANLLRGSTREEIEAHANDLKGALAASAPTPDPARPVPTVGKTPATPGNVSLPEQIAAAEAAGNTELVAALKAVQLGG